MIAPPDPRLVLIADDDREVLNALKFALELEGYQVGAFETGRTLLEAASGARAACLVIDQKLPDTTGLELIMRLRASGVATPSVLITTNLPTHLRIRATTLAIPIVEKPLLTDALFATIRELIGGPMLG
ncbi:response regulator [Phenylobacterium sp. LjRoot164]|uniref:response regulator n=1 Tax=unclassified Phenylobacterium TaxID=2640670 RepID=UPI003ED0A808